MKTRLLLLTLAIWLVVPPCLLAKSPSGFGGDWVRSDDSSSTVNIDIRGENVFLFYSKGTPDTGSIDGDLLTYHGRISGGPVKTSGTFKLLPDGHTMEQNERAFYGEGTKTTRAIWQRRGWSHESVTSETTTTAARTERSDGNGGAQQFVQSFYNWYGPIARSTKLDVPAVETALDRRPGAFSEKLYRALKKETTAQGTTEGRIGLDSDPITNSQDPAPRYTVGNVTSDGKHQNVQVYAAYEGQRRELAVTARVKQQNGQWVFTDFIFPEGGTLKQRLKMSDE